MTLVVTVKSILQNCGWGWLLHWHMSNVPPTTLEVMVRNELQNCKCSWLLHWHMASVQTMMLVDMIRNRLQIMDTVGSYVDVPSMYQQWYW